MSAEEREAVSDDLTNSQAVLEAFEAAEWKAWPSTDCPVPTNAEWEAQAAAMPMSLRLAWLTMTKSRDELLETVAAFESDEPIFDLLEDWERLAGYLQPFIEMAVAARARLEIAWGAHVAKRSAERA